MSYQSTRSWSSRRHSWKSKRAKARGDACIELDTNRYSVPWKLIGEQVSVVVADRQVQLLYAGPEVARHLKGFLSRSSVIDRSHVAGN